MTGHGGDIASAVAELGVRTGGWLDLSTGIAPQPYPFTAPRSDVWHRLPQSDRLAALHHAARRAYGAREDVPIIAAPGTQMLIQLLPYLLPNASVSIVGPTYSEHGICWERAGASVTLLSDLPEAAGSDVLILTNPNNPDGRFWHPERLLARVADQARRNGLLIIDEAFADAMPEISVASHAGREGLIVLRSFGKFYGLAGVRLGFALGPQALITRLNELLGPWAVSGPAMEIGIEALGDLAWQAKALQIYKEQAGRLDQVLSEYLRLIGGTPLYRLAAHPAAQQIQRNLAMQGVLVRRFDYEPSWLRFGLPRDAQELDRLAQALGVAVC